MTTHALIVVDVQNDFCEGGALPVDGGTEVARRITTYVNANPKRYDLIIVTQDWHSPATEAHNGWPVHCRAGTDGARLSPALDINPARHNVRLVRKGQHTGAYSAFEGVSMLRHTLNQLLNLHDVTHIDVAGLALDYCVQATARDAVQYTAFTRLLLPLTAAVSQSRGLDTLAELKALGIHIIT